MSIRIKLKRAVLTFAVFAAMGVMGQDQIKRKWLVLDPITYGKGVQSVIAPAMKYVDSLSRVGGDLRAPRNRFTAYFRCVLIADRPGCDPCRHAPLNIFHCRIYKVELP